MEEEQVSLRPFWGVAEVLGVLGAIAPFVVTVSSLKTETANGVVTKYVFRDWVAVGGGAVAILCAIAVAARWKGTLASKKPLRAAIAAVALALGAFHLLRGFGIIGQPAHDEAPPPPPHVAEVKPPPTPDITPLANDVFAKWQAGKQHDVYAAASKEFRDDLAEDKFDEILARVTAAVGPCQAPAAAWKTKKVDNHDDVWSAKTTATCKNTNITFACQAFVRGGKTELAGFDVDTAEHPTVSHADAVAVGDRLLAALLADDPAAIFAELDPRVIANLNNDPAKLHDSVAGVFAKSGKPGKSKMTTSTDDDKTHHLVYDVAASKYHLTATFTLEYFMTRWFVTDFDLSPAKGK